jgi:hypothetical protein
MRRFVEWLGSIGRGRRAKPTPASKRLEGVLEPVRRRRR